MRATSPSGWSVNTLLRVRCAAWVRILPLPCRPCEVVPEVGPACRGRLVEAPDWRGAWRPLELVGRRLGLLGDAVHDLDEVVQRLERPGLGRLDHQRLLHDQREVDRGRVDAVVEDRLGNVQGGDAMQPLLAAPGEDDL